MKTHRNSSYNPKGIVDTALILALVVVLSLMTLLPLAAQLAQNPSQALNGAAVSVKGLK
jgi:hypothetical protein